MLTFILGLSLGACLGVVIAGICRCADFRESKTDIPELRGTY
jgi:hypothetical protein